MKDTRRTGSPRTSVAEENSTVERKMINEVRRVTYSQIEEALVLNAPAIRLITEISSTCDKLLKTS